MKFVDSSGWLEYFSGGPLAAVYAPLVERPSALLSSPIVLFEVYRKIKRERGEEEALLAVAQIRKARLEPVTEIIALTAADLALEHRLAMADALVLATALVHGAQLVTSDADFAAVPGVEHHPKG